MTTEIQQLRADLGNLRLDHSALKTTVALHEQTLEEVVPQMKENTQDIHNFHKDMAFIRGALKALLVIWTVLTVLFGLWLAYQSLK